MAKKKRDAGSGKTGSLVWAQGLACGVAAALVPSLALMIAVLLGPGLIALVMDHEPGKPIARTVILAGLAGCVTPVRALWAAGHDLDISMALISDPVVIGTAWCAAAAGWLLTEVAPIGVRAVIEAASLARAAQLRAARAKLEEEWGLPPAGTEGKP